MKKILFVLILLLPSIVFGSENSYGIETSTNENMYNVYFFIIIGISVLFFLVDRYIDFLNTKNWSKNLPEKAKSFYDEEKYTKSQLYEKTKYSFGKITNSFMFFITLLLLIFGGFGFLDTFVRSLSQNQILMTLYFFGIYAVAQTILSLPFSYYQTFVIEEKFGFNKMTKGLFVMDTIKSLIVSFLIGGILLSLIVWIYTLLGTSFWYIAWICIGIFMIFMMMFYSTLIVPLFNKQSPLPEGELRKAIFDFAGKIGFQLDNIFVIDGSKRSSKANAYFSGIGPKKRIVLFDTLIQDMTTEELVAVLAHEIGHYKKNHTFQMLAFSLIQMGLILFLFSLVIQNNDIAQALGSSETSFYIGAVAFGFLFTPLSFILGILGNIISRKNEYEADHYAKENYGGSYLISALKKLSVNNLTNLTPHQLYEFVHYSHPTVLKRIDALEKK